MGEILIQENSVGYEASSYVKTWYKCKQNKKYIHLERVQIGEPFNH